MFDLCLVIIIASLIALIFNRPLEKLATILTDKTNILIKKNIENLKERFKKTIYHQIH